jgi:uroporphyrinogen decarboxylase
MNMSAWKRSIIGAGRTSAMPIMTYPGLALTGDRVIDVVRSGRKQAAVIAALAERYPAAAAAVAFMDLSVEAEAFGADVVFADYEVPTVTGRIVEDAASAAALAVPAVGAKRTGEYLDGLTRAAGAVNDRPVFGSCIGPFSLAGRLLDVNDALIMTHTDPDLLHAVLEKCTEFLLAYAAATRAAGADGMLMAEPLAGLLSPAACDTFSSVYIRRVVAAVRGETFAFVLHNCGNTRRLVASMASTGADALHFGNAITMADNIPQVPPDMAVCGNLDPAAVFGTGTPDEVEAATLALLEAMRPWPNFVLSSGCDIPPGTPLANLDRFFEALARFNGESGTRRAASPIPGPGLR